MKTITFLFAVICLSVSYSAKGQHMIFYSNESDGYSLEFPEDWRRADEIKGKLSMVALAPEDAEAEDGVREKLHVAVFDMKSKSKDVFSHQFKESHKEKNKSWKLVEDGELSGRNTVATYFSCYYSDTSTSRTQNDFVYIYFKEKKAFVLTCTTSFDESDKYKDLFLKIATSFSFELAPEEE